MGRLSVDSKHVIVYQGENDSDALSEFDANHIIGFLYLQSDFSMNRSNNTIYCDSKKVSVINQTR